MSRMGNESADLDQSMVTFRMTGTRKLGCVLRQNDRIETQMKNTDTKPTIYGKIIHVFLYEAALRNVVKIYFNSFVIIVKKGKKPLKSVIS